MLMYGLSLRHGWGCARNEKAGFKWLRKAAEHAVEDLERVRMNGDVDVRVIEVSLNDFVLSQTDILIEQTELVLAIYEVGQCFFQGWGVAKDQKMAVVSNRFLVIHVRYLLNYRAIIPLLHD
jgi:TPR repeat protein